MKLSSIVGVVIGTAAAVGFPAQTSAAVRAGATGVALIEIEHPPREEPAPLAWLVGSGDEPTLRELIDRFLDVAADDEFAGLVVRLKDAKLKMSQIEEIGAAMDQVRAAGKKVHLFADGYDTGDFLLGTHADEVILQAGGAVSLPGMYMEEMYLADTLSWIGLTPQLIQVGDFKGANEAIMRNAPSHQWEQNISGLLDGLYGNVREALKASRKLSDAELDNAMQRAWMATGETAREVRLVDTLLDLPDLTDHLKAKYGASEIAWTDYESDHKKSNIDLSNPLALLGKLAHEPEVHASRPSIAVLHITGPIVDGDSEDEGFLGESSVGSHTIRRALTDIEEDDLVKGVVVRIDSPGGSAIASEVIWRGIQRVRATKPVWVSVGSMAASGGYYIAVSGQRIYVNPSSIVGSIGVVGGKVAFGGAYDKLKIHVVGRARGPRGSMMASSTPWTDAEQGMVREKMKETYDLFESRVAAGRDGIDLSKTAAGRLFTGRAAIGVHMADKIGGLDDAIEDLATELGLEGGQFEVLDFPGPKSVAEVLGKLFGRFGASAPATSAEGAAAVPAITAGLLRELVGPRNWPAVRDNLSALAQLREEPVLLVAPRVMIFK